MPTVPPVNTEHPGTAADGGKAVAAAWRRDYPMARLSSWRAGGRAAWLFTPQRLGRGNRDNPMLTLPYALPPQVQEAGSEPVRFIGYGSNLLVRDGGYDGIIVRTAPALSTLVLNDDGAVYAGAGAGCPKLARFCAAAGLDAAFFAGIPGTVGGALAMNAGCYGEETWNFVQAVDIFSAGAIKSVDAAEFDIDYRQVCHKSGQRVYFAAAHFRFAPAADTDKIKKLLRQRAATQPLSAASAGSVFRNPPNNSAGRLIEQCGLKNACVGGAVVSDKHANFIINKSDASAADIESLILHIQEQVAVKTGIRLLPEVQLIGRAA